MKVLSKPDNNHEISCPECRTTMVIDIDDVHFDKKVIDTDCMGNAVEKPIPYVICPTCGEYIDLQDFEFTKKEYKEAFEKCNGTTKDGSSPKKKNPFAKLLYS